MVISAMIIAAFAFFLYFIFVIDVPRVLADDHNSSIPYTVSVVM